MDFLLVDKRNVELVSNKLKDVHAAFINYERVHTEDFGIDESRLNGKVWIFPTCRSVDSQLSGSPASMLKDDIRPRDSVSHHGTSATKSSQHSSSRLSVKIKEAKVERAVAELRLQQLKKKLKLQERCDALLRQQELLDAENDIEAAALKARILEAGIGNARISAESVLSVPSSKTVWMVSRKKCYPLLQLDH